MTNTSHINVLSFKNIYVTTPDYREQWTFDDLDRLFLHPQIYYQKEAAPLFSFAFLKNSSEKLVETNVESNSAIILDIDGIHYDELKYKLSPYQYLLYPTYSSFMVDKPSPNSFMFWRVILPLTKCILLGARVQLDVLAESLRLPIKSPETKQRGIDPQAWPASHRFFFPSIPAASANTAANVKLLKSLYFVDKNLNAPPFPADILEGARLSSVKVTTKTVMPSSETDNNSLSLLQTSFVKERLYTPIEDGERHGTLIKIATYLLVQQASKCTYDEFAELIFDYDERFCQPPLSKSLTDKKELDKIILDVWQKYQHLRGTKQEVEDRVLSSDEVKDAIEQGVTELNTLYAYVYKLQRIWRVQYRDFIKASDFLVETAKYQIQVPVKTGFKTLRLGRLWLEAKSRREARGIIFKPGKATIIQELSESAPLDGASAPLTADINIWRGWGCECKRSALYDEHIMLFNNFLSYLFSNDVKAVEWFTAWAAYPLQHPGIKLLSAVLLWGRHGVGKSLLGDVVGRIYGHQYKRIESSDLNSPFNGWLQNTQFVVGNEILTSDNKRAQNDRIKNLITGDVIFLNEKFQPCYSVDNCANFFFTSNHSNAMAIEATERRFFVIETPRLINQGLLNSVVKTYGALQKDLEATSNLMSYLVSCPRYAVFDPALPPYKTSALDEMIDSSRSDIEAWLLDGLSNGFNPSLIKSDLVQMKDLQYAYSLTNPKGVTFSALKNALHRVGFDITRLKRDVKIIIQGKRKTCRLVAITNSDVWMNKEVDEWRAEYEKYNVL